MDSQLKELPDLYRFALLLTGDTRLASRVIIETLKEAGGQISQFRNVRHRDAWLVAKIRECCMKKKVQADGSEPAVELEADAAAIVQKFSTLEEPDRSALALFYLDLFDITEIANIFNMSMEDLSEALAGARAVFSEQNDGLAVA